MGHGQWAWGLARGKRRRGACGKSALGEGLTYSELRTSGEKGEGGGGYVARDDDDYWVHDMKKLIKWGKSIC